jgi:hypothetical protein
MIQYAVSNCYITVTLALNVTGLEGQVHSLALSSAFTAAAPALQLYGVQPPTTSAAILAPMRSNAAYEIAE